MRSRVCADCGARPDRAPIGTESHGALCPVCWDIRGSAPAPADHPTIRKTWVDGGYRKHLVEYAATLGIDMEISARTPGTRGFTPIPKRWAVERTYGWLMLHRRLARDYELPRARGNSYYSALRVIPS
ncbi:hypothetical protein GCM10011578_101540 [Streptomyces fuscichromogenes]|uniref:Transposase n=1 Tax=Streptomyces fuscichromogenes TaxID=1324013 RepID=A0A918CXV8_9ACTN|nr:hypothetical protein GCM10011578_101540 [Streptomyces fuscichromogenes]